MTTTMTADVRGPAWCEPGLDLRGGRYPLSVESPVMGMVDTLVPGVSTLTRLVRYYSLYWALADAAARREWDAGTCQTVLRRSEVALALVSRGNRVAAHGADRVEAMVDQGRIDEIAAVGRGSYSPRPWGFWSQYNGPSAALGTVVVEAGALRPGPRGCPLAVRNMFLPLLELAHDRPVRPEDADGLSGLAMDAPDTADLEPLRALITASPSARYAPDWTGDDRTRRSTLRILARSAQLRPDASSWSEALHDCVAYGSRIRTDPVLLSEERAQAWRGTLLRRLSVGAWRRLWAALVDQVTAHGSATRDDLHQWISTEVPAMTVRDFLTGCPPLVDAGGEPSPAERQTRNGHTEVTADLAALLFGGQRKDQLTGRSRAAFLGRHPERKQYLDPHWVAYRHREHEGRPMAEFARAFVDDMLAQSRRVALRKLKVEQGRMKLFTKLHERNGRYYAAGTEGAGNVGLRVDQLEFIARQLGLAALDGPGLAITPLAVRVLELEA
jgi:hypothetical protein